MTPEEARKQQLDDVKDLMKLKSGQRFIWRLLGMAGIFQANIVDDHAQMAAREGRRQLGLTLFADIIETCPEKYLGMIKTNKEVIIDGTESYDQE